MLEHAENGTLFSLIHNNQKLTEVEARKYALQLLDAIEYMHSKKVFHRDLKPENILLDSDMNIKLCDFGSCKIVTELNKDDKMSFVGTAEYIPPELLQDKDHAR